MRGILLTGALAAFGAVNACANANEDAQPVEQDGARDLTDAASDASDASDGDAAVVEPPARETCSSAGWCLTDLPDEDLTLIDIWPLEGRAFAVAVSASLGAKVLEWVEADQHWSYIDDDTQNEDGFGRYVGRIWAPNGNEVYYTVEPGYVYHGTRDGMAWEWTRTLLVPTIVSPSGQDYSAPSLNAPHTAPLGVWGTATGDVYAWRANTIYRRVSGDGGAPSWVVDYSEGTASQRTAIYSAAASSTGEVWFGGGSSGTALCPLLLRKGADGYQTVFRSVFPKISLGRVGCGPEGGVAALAREVMPTGGTVNTGVLIDLGVGSDGVVTALWRESTVVRVAPSGGGYDYKATGPITRAGTQYEATSIWLQGSDTWFSASGLVRKGTVAGGVAEFDVSSIAMNGVPHTKPLYRIRGTGPSNLWAVGARYAFHKTMP